MDNAQKAIMIGVGLFLTIALITAVLFITGIGQNLLSSATGQAQGLASSTELQAYAKYNNTKVTGADVLSAVNQYRDSTSVGVLVYNGAAANKITVGKYDLTTPLGAYAAAGTTLQTAAALPANATNTAARLYTDPTSATMYINPALYYNSDLVVFNGKVIGIGFQR